MSAADFEIQAASRVLAGRALLVRAASALEGRRIVPLVLKGVLISALTEGSGAAPRTMLDVDVLVDPRDRRVAERDLVAAGLEVVARAPFATTLRDRSLGIDLDLHERLVEPELFRLDPVVMLARSTENVSIFGVGVRVPDRYDLYAHLIAHFARNRSNARDRRRLRDLGIVAMALPMDPERAARHVMDLGLGRAARYVLPLADARGDAFARSVLRLLSADPTGDLLARGAGMWLSHFAGNTPLAIPALHALNHSVPAGARSLTMHAVRAGTSRARGIFQRPAHPR